MAAKDIYGPMLNNPGVDFRMVRDGRRSPLFWKDFDLSVARSVAAGSAEVFNAAGDSFFCDMDPVNQGVGVVHFQDTSISNVSAPVYVSPGFIASVPFTQMLVENAAQPGKRLRIFYGVGLDFHPSGAQSVNVAGTVSVLDAGKARAIAGQSFIAVTGTAATVGLFGDAQLWNPLGSGKNILLRQFSGYMSVAGNLSAYYKNVACPALSAVVNSNGGVAGAKMGSGTIGVQPASAQMQLGVPANSLFTYLFTDPIILRPGQGFSLIPFTANVAITANYEWFEE